MTTYPVSLRFLAVATAVALVCVWATSAYAHDDDHQEDDGPHSNYVQTDIMQTQADLSAALPVASNAELEQIITLLTEMVSLLETKKQQQVATVLMPKWIDVETHDGQTHVHVVHTNLTGTDFWIAPDMSDRSAVIAAIAEHTGWPIATVTEAVIFVSVEPTATHDDHHDHDHHDHGHGHEASVLDITGIHIMPDGSVMLGNGEIVPDAAVNDAGMIVLPDGTTVTPEMDMR